MIDSVEYAAEHLPDGYEIRILVEKGAGWVELWQQDFKTGMAGQIPIEFNIEYSIEDQIRIAVKVASMRRLEAREIEEEVV